jgi:very-short-patch-repair endonuclease
MSEKHIDSFLQSEYSKLIRHFVDDANAYWFSAIDVANIIGLKHIRSQTKNIDSNNKQLVDIDTIGGRQSTTYLSLNAVIKLIIKSRKYDVLKISKAFDIDVDSKHYMCIEADTLQCICQSFQGLEMVLQFKVDKYMIDLYFVDYKIAVECDECYHAKQKQHKKDVERETKIRELIPNIMFIRYSPQNKAFNIFKVINEIFNCIQGQHK